MTDPSKKRKTTQDINNGYDVSAAIDGGMDQLLNLESQYYEDGFSQGQQESTRKQMIEGKEYGYQTGFQRFLVVGYIRGLHNYWLENLSQYESKSLSNHLLQLEAMLAAISTGNGDKEVEIFEKNVVKSRNKVRVISNIVKEQWKVNKLDELLADVGGQMQVSEKVDDMW